jgi:hypothetical protein
LTWIKGPADAQIQVKAYDGEWESSLLGGETPFSVEFDRPGVRLYHIDWFSLGPAPGRWFSQFGIVTVQQPIGDNAQIMITSPPDDFHYALTEPIYIWALPSVPHADIDYVEFFSGGDLIGTSTNAPHGTVYKDATPGPHRITVRVVKTDTNYSISDPIRVIVEESPRNPRFTNPRIHQNRWFLFDLSSADLRSVFLVSTNLMSWHEERLIGPSSTYIREISTNEVRRFYRVVVTGG